MALMTEQERIEVWQSDMERNDSIFSLLKLDLKAAVDTSDEWVQDNQASFNNSLPVTARTQLNQKQKALLLTLVIAKRFSLGIF